MQEKTDQSLIDVQSSFELTLRDANLSDITVDVAELAIDNVLKEGLLRDIPVMNTLISLAKFGANVRDKLFAKKMLTFLVGLKDIPEEERNRVIGEIDNSKQYRVKVGEKLLFIIDSCSDYENTERIALVFRAFVKGEISYDDFLDCANILEKIATRDFKWFIKHGGDYLRVDDVGSLMSVGLFDWDVQPVDVQVREKWDEIADLRKRLGEVTSGDRDNLNKEYKTDVSGGDIILRLSDTGEIIMTLFNPEYKSKS